MTPRSLRSEDCGSRIGRQAFRTASRGRPARSAGKSAGSACSAGPCRGAAVIARSLATTQSKGRCTRRFAGCDVHQSPCGISHAPAPRAPGVHTATAALYSPRAGGFSISPIPFLFPKFRSHARLQAMPIPASVPPALSGRVGASLERFEPKKFGGGQNGRRIYCNPLKFHKTAKGMFGKIWRKKAWFWKSLAQSLGGFGGGRWRRRRSVPI
jgi:hypothetical protein